MKLARIQHSPETSAASSQPSKPAFARRTPVRPSSRRVCLLLARASSAESSSSQRQQDRKPRVAVVGGGWAGFGAAHALVDAGADVTLLDAAEQPGGLSSAWTTPQGRVVEPGIKGFWYQYSNIEALVRQLGIESPFTDWTRSAFWAPDGLQVTAPVLQDLPRLPTPLGSFLHTSPYFTRLSLQDRLTALPLVKALLEFDRDEATYSRYDKMSAYELFRSAGVSRALYEQFLEPMLLVTLFAPPEELSAAAALGALYYFVLAHQPDFDVRWCKGPIAERIFTPLVDSLRARGASILGGRRVTQVLAGPGGLPSGLTTSSSSGQQEVLEGLDAVVFAMGITAMQGLVRASPLLAGQPDFAAVSSLGTTDVLAVRIWLDRRMVPPTKSNVVARFDRGIGGTFFDLNALQEQYAHEAGSVVEVDLYHAQALLPLSDQQIIDKVLHGYLARCLPEYGACRVLDASVMRFRGAVSAFSPGSHQHLPPTCTSLPNAFMAGDWVRQGPGTHGAKGLSQEKAYASGLQAGNAAARRCGLVPAARVLPVEPDEPHMAAAKEAARVAGVMEAALRGMLPPLLPAPLL